MRALRVSVNFADRLRKPDEDKIAKDICHAVRDAILKAGHVPAFVADVRVELDACDCGAENSKPERN